MAEPSPLPERREPELPGASPIGDLLYDAFYSAAIGGAVIALFYLFADLLQARPLFTPSMVGSVWFLDVPPAEVTGVDLEMVAYMTLFHLAGFGALGFAIAYAVSKMERSPRRPVVVTVLIFLALEAGVLIPPTILRPGLIEALGFWRIFVGNFLAAIAMAAFIWQAHRPDEPAMDEEPVGEPDAGFGPGWVR